MRHELQTLEEAPPPAQIPNLSIATWSDRPLRGVGMEFFRCGAFHVVASQEFEEGQEVEQAAAQLPPQVEPRR